MVGLWAAWRSDVVTAAQPLRTVDPFIVAFPGTIVDNCSVLRLRVSNGTLTRFSPRGHRGVRPSGEVGERRNGLGEASPPLPGLMALPCNGRRKGVTLRDAELPDFEGVASRGPHLDLTGVRSLAALTGVRSRVVARLDLTGVTSPATFFPAPAAGRLGGDGDLERCCGEEPPAGVDAGCCAPAPVTGACAASAASEASADVLRAFLNAPAAEVGCIGGPGGTAVDGKEGVAAHAGRCLDCISGERGWATEAAAHAGTVAEGTDELSSSEISAPSAAEPIRDHAQALLEEPRSRGLG
jgi:hypothetical protein